MNERQRHELSLLAAGLGTVPPERFQMEFWTNGGFDCAFAGCAIGWGTTIIPDFGIEMVSLYHDNSGLYKDHNPVYHGVVGMDAVALYFGMPCQDAYDLFSPDAYRPSLAHIPPETVAKRIRKYLDNFGKKGRWAP